MRRRKLFTSLWDIAYLLVFVVGYMLLLILYLACLNG